MSPSTEVYVATKTAHLTDDGSRVLVRKGVTRVRAGHPLLAAYPNLFAPVTEGVRFDVETAKAEPVVPVAPVKPLARKTAAKTAASKDDE